VEFLPQCDKVVIMDKGNVVYFGPWNDGAQQILSRYLPTSHLLASAGAAEQPKPKKGKAIKKAEEKKDTAPKGASKEHSASLTISAAIIEYGWEARWWLFCLSFLTFLATQTSRQMADFFIRWWTSDYYGKYKGQCIEGICYGNFYAIFYATLTGIFLILMLFRGAFLYLWALGASQRIHEKSVHRILYAPLGFFFSVSTSFT
jgi:ATP-binding cassette, subfamily C (CFTR/MRP), member 1